MNRRLVAAAAALLVAGALAWFAAGRTWGSETTRAAFGARQHVAVSGHDVSSALVALPVALLALGVAVVAGSGVLRRLAGALAALCGAALVAAAVQARSRVGTSLARHLFAVGRASLGGSRPAWWVLSLVCGAVAVLAGALVAIRGGAWHGMGTRYETPAGRAGSEDAGADAWDAIERGDDPTVVRHD